MSQRAFTDDSASSGGNTGYISGDLDPEDFSYTTPLTRTELMYLFLRNSKIKKAVAWFAGEIMRERWQFKEEQPITGQKHGKDYPFKAFMDWLEWNGFMQEALKAIMWALLFGDSIMVFYDGKEEESEKYINTQDLLLKGGGPFIKCKAFYEAIADNGYTIEETNPFFGYPTLYKIKLTTYRSEHGVTYYVDANTRVVRFSAPQMELKYAGNSTVSTIAKDCIVQELAKRATAVQLMNVAGGILACRVSGEAEKIKLETEIADVLTHLKKVYASGNMSFEEMFKIIVPELKIDQLANMNELLQQDIATGIDMSISNLEGAPQGALSSAEYDTFNTYSKVKQLQSHFKRAFEECFFKLGKTNTEFQWFDPTPQIGMNQNGPSNESPNTSDNPGDKEAGDTNASDTPHDGTD